MGDSSQKNDRIDDLKTILTKYSLDNPSLLEELINWGIPEKHPKFELGEECCPLPKVEVEDNPIEEEFIDLSIEDDPLLRQLIAGTLKHRDLEKKVTAEKAVQLRRRYFKDVFDVDLSNIPYEKYDYEIIKGACCENPIGYIQVPVGTAGPLRIEGQDYHVPLATTEGALIASISRGCKVVSEGMGVQCFVEDIGMTRAPYFSFHNHHAAQKFYEWINDSENFPIIKSEFERHSRFLKLKDYQTEISDCLVFVRFRATSGDAMGMNMVSRGCQNVVDFIKKQYGEEIKEICLSSNLCTDKKAAAINWIKGRGKRVSSSVVISQVVVEKQLHTTVDTMVDLCEGKCNVGSALAGTIGGNNAQAANAVAAIFIATGQDAAQVVSSSMCMTTMSKTDAGDLKVTCTMRCLEVGTLGGGTILGPQQNFLRMLSCAGPHPTNPGENSKKLAKIICSTVLAGEVSLMAALCSGDLVKTHLKMNRSTRNLHSNTDTNLLKAALRNPAPSRLSQPKTRIENSTSALIVDRNHCAKDILKRHSDCFNLT